MAALSTAAQRERGIIAAALLGIAAVAWAYMIYEARAMNVTGVCACLGMAMGGNTGAAAAWPLGSLLPLVLMWAGMMVAMMLPSAMPMILTFATVSRNRRQHGRPYVPAAVFVGGYVIVWSLFSIIVAIAQWLLHRAALLSPGMASSSAWLGGLLLLAAGIFQFTSLKHSCLAHCRAPLEFIMAHWREGNAGALRMGLEHGLYCTGCCWALMCLLFVLGVMNIYWIAALTLLVGLEKIVPRGLWLSSATGLILTAWGAVVIARGTL